MTEQLSSGGRTATWLEIEPTAAEARQGVITKARHSRFPAVVVVQRTTKKLDKDFDIKTLPVALEASYKRQVNGFKLISNKPTRLGSYQAVMIHYEHPKRGQTYSNMTLVIPMQWQTFYISLSAKKTDSKLLEKDFPRVSMNFLKSAFLQ